MNEAAFKKSFDAVNKMLGELCADPDLAGHSAEDLFGDLLSIVAYKARATGVDPRPMLEALVIASDSPGNVNALIVGMETRVSARVAGKGW